MESKPIARYILFGEVLWYLRYVQEGWPVHGKRNVLFYIDDIFNYLEEFKLPVSRRAAHSLNELRKELAKSDLDRKLTADEASEISQIMGDLEKTLLAEAHGNIAFIVTDKRIDVDKLLYDVPSLMAPGVFDSLPDIARYDFGEAGKCIAFELPTAAAFHLLRGTEAVLRYFYCSIVKRGRVEILWGPMVEHLRERRASLPRPLLDNLDNIRRSFRNPTQHPDKIYDIQEVQDLFGLCVDAVNRMAALL